MYDYVPSKADWLARGLPRQGTKAAERRAIDAIRDDVVTARLDEPVGEVRARVDASDYGFAFVVAPDRTLLGRLRKAALEGEPDALAEELMEGGPSTVRADTPIDKLRERLEKRDLKTAVVTDPEGVLLGVVRRRDL